MAVTVRAGPTTTTTSGRVISFLLQNQQKHVYAVSRRNFGTWMGEQRQHTPERIISHFTYGVYRVSRRTSRNVYVYIRRVFFNVHSSVPAAIYLRGRNKQNRNNDEREPITPLLISHSTRQKVFGNFIFTSRAWKLARVKWKRFSVLNASKTLLWWKNMKVRKSSRLWIH